MRKRLLIGFLIDGKSGGTDIYIMNLIDILSESYDIEVLCKVQSDFLDDYMKSRGVKCHYVSGLKKIRKQFSELKNIISNGKFDISYLNTSTAVMIMMPFLSYLYKIPVRVVHSHSSGIDIKNKTKRRIIFVMHFFGKKIMYVLSNRYFSCSKNAGLWMFPKKIVDESKYFQIVPNPVDMKKYLFDEKKRNQMRINFEDTIILGHVSNYQQVKNTRFLIDVLYEVLQRKRNAKLLLIGDGAEKKAILQYAEQLGLQDKIIDVGYQRETSDFYQMMDFFLLPSLFEGFPLVAIEAQAAKLSCLLSNCITMDVKLSSETVFLPIDNNAGEWAEYIVNKYPYDRERVVLSDDIKQYDKMNLRELMEKLLLK